MKKKLIAISMILTMVVMLGISQEVIFASEGTVNVQMYNSIKSETTNSISQAFKIINTGDSDINLSDVTLQYYYTVDDEKNQSFWCDYAALIEGYNHIGITSYVTGSFVKMDSATDDADYYLEISFDSDAGTLTPGSDVVIYGRFAKSDWSNYTQTNDYSFNSSSTQFDDWDKVTLYVQGELMYGTAPLGGEIIQSSTITPTYASFDKSGDNNEDIEVVITPNGNELISIENDSTTLVENTDYTISEDVVTIKNSYLASLAIGTNILTFKFSAGSDAVLSVSVINTDDIEPTDSVGITWMDGELLFPLGVNYAWYDWCYDFSDYNWSVNFENIKSDLDTMAEQGVNAVRWWVFPDLAWGPTWTSDERGSLCTGLPDNWVANMKELCDYALSKDIKIYWTITSFDLARQDNGIDHDDIINDSEVRQSFLDNAVKPILLELGDHEGVMGWDVINEPEWIVSSEDGGAPKESGYVIFSLEEMREYIKATVDFIHEYAEQPVSFGSANMKWLGAQYDIWRDLGVDFYDFHWYDWATEWFNPIETPAADLGLDKPVIIGEMMPNTIDSSLNMSHKEVLDAIYENGYAGYLLWAWNDSGSDCKEQIENNFIEFGLEHPDVVW